MSVETIVLDFQVVGCTDNTVYVRDVATVATCVAEALTQDCLEQGSISSAYSYATIYRSMLYDLDPSHGPKDSMFTVKHYFREGLITLTIEYFKINDEDALFPDFDSVERLERLIKKNLDADTGYSIPAIKRCLPKSTYMMTSDNRLLQYKWEKTLFSEKSPWQLVEIFQTKDFGAVLILDDYVNLAESDTVYTHNLMCKGKMDYKDKNVLILGGGDGALLYELLQEKNAPKHVTMVDIDETVIRACREHMKSVHGGLLDNLKGDKYEIIVDDAFKWLAKYQEEGTKFDYIFGDLTDIPVHEDGDTWEFVRSILQKSFAILPKGGKYLTHCNGKNSPKALQLYENLLNSLGVPLEFKRTEAFVPSFMETWVFYQVTKTGEDKAEVTNGVKGGAKEEKPKEEKEKPKKEGKDKEAASPTKEDKKKGSDKGAKGAKDAVEKPKKGK